MANTQTSVPLFVANAILTAEQQNISAATGVPVFATTVTRDAAFGGANKALAEGQLCYLESTNVVQYYDGAAWATVGPTTSKFGQIVQTVKSDTYTQTATSFTDITGFSVSITPTLATSQVLVMLSANIGMSDIVVTLRLLRDSTTIYAGTAAGTRPLGYYGSSENSGTNIFNSGGIFLDSPATTSATTYKVQMALYAATGYLNRNNRDTDGTDPRLASSITVIEILA